MHKTRSFDGVTQNTVPISFRRVDQPGAGNIFLAMGDLAIRQDILWSRNGFCQSL